MNFGLFVCLHACSNMQKSCVMKKTFIVMEVLSNESLSKMHVGPSETFRSSPKDKRTFELQQH
jgi:hypothetical protein